MARLGAVFWAWGEMASTETKFMTWLFHGLHVPLGILSYIRLGNQSSQLEGLKDRLTVCLDDNLDASAAQSLSPLPRPPAKHVIRLSKGSNLSPSRLVPGTD